MSLTDGINPTKKLPELLSPAGDREKLEAALLYGADAVYLAGKSFGMRAASANFTTEALDEAVKFAHERGKKVYLTVNTMPRTREYPELERYLEETREIDVDAYIAADLGVIALLKRVKPDAVVHVSTQASVVSAETVREYAKLGASRVVLARELSLDEIAVIRGQVPDVELETFVHGSMCVSYSGLCLLSEHMTGRDANMGQCAQPCRWNWRLIDNSPRYSIEEREHKGEALPIEEDEYGSFVMSARDMCMIEHVGELCEAGIDCFKIEGRVKSAYYTAVTANAYRIALDDWAAGKPFDPLLLREVESVSHRDFGTGHFFGKAEVCEHSGYLRDRAYLATAVSDAAPGETAVFIQRNKVSAGDAAELLTPGKTGRAVRIGRMFGEDGEEIESAPHPLMLWKTALDCEVKRGDILRGC